MRADVVVAGGGMAGITAALTAQEAGCRVVLLEKAPRIGGSAAESGGTVWCASDSDEWLAVQPGGSPSLGGALVAGFFEGVDWLRKHGVSLAERPDRTSYRFKRIVYAMEPDAGRVLASLARDLVRQGGTIMAGIRLQEIILDDAQRVAGVIAQGGSGPSTIQARQVVLATGGFQGSAELRLRHMGEWADRMVLRANPHSTGDGLAAAVRVGAAVVGPFDRFYGHLVPAPPARVGLHNFAQVKPDFSHLAILVNLRGERFDDEFFGDEVTVHSAARQPGATVFVIFDEAIRRRVTREAEADMREDRLASMAAAGTEILTASSLAELARATSARWGVDRQVVERTIREYNEAVTSGSARRLNPPRSGGMVPIDEAPLYAIRFTPGITFTYGGLKVDERARVLREDGEPLHGLFAAGADMGGVYTRGYSGGLSLALAFGRVAGKGASART